MELNLLHTADPPSNPRQKVGKIRQMHRYVIFYCANASTHCPMLMKVGGLYEDIALPNFKSLVGKPYSHVYVLVGNVPPGAIKDRQNGCRVPNTGDCDFSQPPTTSCAQQHARAAAEAGWASLDNSINRRPDREAFQELQHSADGILHASLAAKEIRAQPHAPGLNLSGAPWNTAKAAGMAYASKRRRAAVPGGAEQEPGQELTIP